MSYPKDLDEYTIEDLRNEIAERKSYKAKKPCTYCRRPYSTSECQYTARHSGRTL